MIELDGVQYPLKSAQENTQDLLATINKYCADNNIVNSKGEVIYIDNNPANVLYMMLYGVGVLAAQLQSLLYSAGAGFSIGNSSERQLLNLAYLANVKRTPATKTTMTVFVISRNDVTIPTTQTITIPVGGVPVVFEPAYQYQLTANQGENILMVAQEYGSYSIAANSVTNFDDPLSVFSVFTQYASIPGTDEESIADLRQRIQKRQTSTTRIEQAADAIQNLNGVSRCSIYFNESITQTVEFSSGDIQVPPRHALILCQGMSNDIPQTLYKYLMCQTAQGPQGRNTRLVYTTKAGQALPVNVVSPETVPVYIRVYVVANNLPEATVVSLKNTLVSLASQAYIGTPFTSAQVLTLMQEQYPTYTFQGCDLSLDGLSWSYKVVPETDQLVVFRTGNMSVVEVQQ